jgi:hypothetical protein
VVEVSTLTNGLNIGGPRQLAAAERFARRQTGEVRVVGWGSRLPHQVSGLPALMVEYHRDGKRKLKEFR